MRMAKRHSSPLHVLFHTTNVKKGNYETILPAHQHCNYKLLADIHVDDDRTKVITDAKALTGLRAYCNGLGMEGQIGAAAILTVGNTELCSVCYHLGTKKEHTVYEVEITAVILVLHLLSQVECSAQTVTIGVDNQAVLLGLKNQQSKPGHHLLDRAHGALEDFQVKQTWNRGHIVEGYWREEDKHDWTTVAWDGKNGTWEGDARLNWCGHQGMRGSRAMKEWMKKPKQQWSHEPAHTKNYQPSCIVRHSPSAYQWQDRT